MKNKTLRLLCAAVVCLFALSSLLTVAVSANEATVDEEEPIFNDVRYTNPDTGYEILINDDLDYMTPYQENSLTDKLITMTQYANVYFITTDHDTEDIFDMSGEEKEYPNAAVLIYSVPADTIWFGTQGEWGDLCDDDLIQKVVDEINGGSWYSGALYGFTELYNLMTGQQIDVLPSSELFLSTAVRYINPENQYQVVILDELDLLTDEEEADLVEQMKPITAYGSAAFWTNEQYAKSEHDQARSKRAELFEYENACIFVINMNIRKLTINSYGTLEEYITDSIERSITNNVSHYATAKQYYDAASTAFDQIYKVIDGQNIPEPMKVTGYIVISLILGLTLALSVAFSQRFNPLRAHSNDTSQIKGHGSYNTKGKKVKVSETVRNISSSSGSGGCSSCGSGGSSCGGGGGCGGGSSCGGGGGCGSSGSSSF